MKAKIYIGAKKYALYIGRKIVDTTLEFLTLPARFVSNKVQELKNIILYGNSVQDGTFDNILDATQYKSLSGLSTDTGLEIANNSYRVSYFIPIEGETEYIAGCTSIESIVGNHTFKIWTYDAEQQPLELMFIDNVTGENVSKTFNFVTNENAKFIRVQWRISHTDLFVKKASIPILNVGEKSKNLFDINTSTYGTGTCWSAGGIATPETNYYGSNKIQVEGGKTYTRTYTNTSANYFTLKDGSHTNVVNKGTVNQGVTIIVPDDAVEFYFNCDNNIDPTTLQVVEGDKLLNYVPEYWEDYKVPVEIKGKNLLDKNNLIDGYYSATGVLTDYSRDTYKTYDKFPVKPNTNYIASSIAHPTLAVYWRLCFWDKDKKIISRDTRYINVQIGFNTGDNIAYVSISPEKEGWEYDLQLEEGTQATDYEPYIEPSTTNIYINQPLRKVGEYADTLSIKGNNVTVTRNVKVIDETGDKTIEESLIHKVPSTTETYTIDNPIELQEGSLTIDVNTNIKPSKIELIGEVEYDN